MTKNHCVKIGSNSIRLTRTFSAIRIPLIVFLLLTGLAYQMAGAVFAGKDLKKNILVMHSYHKGLGWTDSITKGIETVISKSQYSVELHYQYMDTKRNYDDQYLALYHDLLKHKFSKRRFDIVLCSDDHAFRFLMKYHAALFPQTPVVFCGVNYFTDDLIKDNPWVTGVVESFSIKGTIDAALTVSPGSRHVFYIADDTVTGTANKKLLSDIIPLYGEKLLFSALEGSSMTELLERSRNLPEDSIVLLLGFTSDRQGHVFSLEESSDLISSVCNRPIYSFWDFHLNHGIVGGVLTTGVSQGESAAGIAIRILDGETPASIPVIKKGTNQLIFDYQVMKKFNISEKHFPEGSRFINKPLSFYELHKRLVWQVAIAFVLLASALLMAMINLVKRRATEASLKRSEDKFRALVETTSDWIWETDIQLVYTYVSPKVEDLLGYLPEDVFGRQFYDFINKAERENVKPVFDHMKQFKVSFVQFEHGSIHKSGHEILVETTSVPIMDSQGELIGYRGIDRDITQRKRAEDDLRESEEKFRIINNSAKDAIIMIDAKGVVVSWNPAAELIFGYSNDEMVGLRLHDILMPDHYTERFENGFRLYQKTGEGNVVGNVVELVAKRKDGSSFPIEISVATITIKNEYGATAIIRDITKRKQAEQELRSLRNYLINIINSMPSILIGVDREGRVTQWNKKAEQETGISTMEAAGQSLAKVFPRMEPQMERIFSSIVSREIKQYPQQIVRQEGTTRYEDLIIFPLSTDGDEGAVIRIDDVTEKVLINEMIIQSEKMMSIGGLAAGMAHEINNPLASMMQNAQVIVNRLTQPIPANTAAAEKAGTTLAAIRTFMDSRNVLRQLEMIHESGVRAAKIVENMLSFARKSDSSRAPANIPDLLEKTVALIRSDYDLSRRYDFKQIEVIRDYGSNVPEVFCDENKIQQVFFNLLKNCSEAMGDAALKKPSPRVELKVTSDPPWIRIEIADNGPGMERSVTKRIFEPFFSTKGVGKGTGLGLSVSYFIIVNDHKGEMWVESIPGSGSRFIIRLPFGSEFPSK